MGKSKAKLNGKKPAAEDKEVYLEPEHTKSRITDFEFKELIVLPREIDLNKWLASNTTTFFHHINLQYNTISEFCTGETCQTMAVCNTQYYWYDELGKKVKCTAPQYIDFVMSSVQKLATDEDVFPTKYDTLDFCWRKHMEPECPLHIFLLCRRPALLSQHLLLWAEPLGDRLLGTLWRSGSNCKLLRPIQRGLVVGAWPPCRSVTCGLPLGREFPSSFESLVKKLYKYLFHVLGHIYWAHFKETLALELHGHLNTLYVHFLLFAREFNLLDPKETSVMDNLTEVLCSSPGNSGATGDGASRGASGTQNHVKER